MVAGAIVLLFLAGAIALFSSRALYGDQAVGKIPVGVVLPGEDALAKQAFSMISSLDSVKSLCEFQYLEREECLNKLAQGELYAMMEVPEQLVQGIMDGSNPPIRVLFPEHAGVESRVFQELTDAGARILSSAQAGIYAGNEICRYYGLEAQIPRLEEDLNRIFLSYSLPREDYFRQVKVSATGELDTVHFYGVSAYVLILLLSAIPVSGYLVPWRPVMKQKLGLAGVRPVAQVGARIAGLGFLFFCLTSCIVVMTAAAGYLHTGNVGPWHGKNMFLSVAAMVFICFMASSFVVMLYRIAGTMMGGMMLLFLAVTAGHFLAGGFLPLVFLPTTLQRLSVALPSAVLMKGAAMVMTAGWNGTVFAWLAAWALGAMAVTLFLEVRET